MNKTYPRILSARSFTRIQIPDEVKTRSVKKVNQYIFLKKIGVGGSSKVYLAQDTLTNNYVSIKLLSYHSRPTSNFFHQVLREVRIMRNLRHPNLVCLLEVLH